MDRTKVFKFILKKILLLSCISCSSCQIKGFLFFSCFAGSGFHTAYYAWGNAARPPEGFSGGIGGNKL